MQNEFEKQVQQKMEELKLVPSDPVWQKVEMQIRKKKDRRRMIFWIPLGVLLLSGGLWLGIDKYSGNIAYGNHAEKPKREKHIQNPPSQSEPSITKQTMNEQNDEELQLPPQPQKKAITSLTHKDISFNDLSLQKIGTQKTEGQKNNSILLKENHSSVINNGTVFTGKEIESSGTNIKLEKLNEQTERTSQPADSAIEKAPVDQKNESTAGAENETEVSVEKTDSLKIDSVFKRQPGVKKIAASKWKLAFAVSGGISGSGKLNVFNGFLAENKSMDYVPPLNAGSGPGNVTLYYPPSKIRQEVSFGVQAGLRKQLTPQIFFSVGLGYNYYGNSILVGDSVAQNLTIRNYSVTQYFSNNNNNYSNGSLKSYHNHYHFVSLPLAIDWQLLKKHPLNLSTGISLQYLAQTNGLIFDYNYQAYFHNKNAFNRMQLFSNLGLNYSFPVKKSSIAIGPELQYGLSELEKDNSNHHLYRYGLKAQLQLK